MKDVSISWEASDQSQVGTLLDHPLTFYLFIQQGKNDTQASFFP